MRVRIALLTLITGSLSSTVHGQATCLFGNDTAFIFVDYVTAIINATPPSNYTTQWLNSSAQWLTAVRSVQTGNVTKPEPRLPLIAHTAATYTPGYPEIDPNNFFFAELPSVLPLVAGTPGAALAPPFTANVTGGELFVSHFRYNSAMGNGLLVALRSQGVKKVVMSGSATSEGILATSIALSDLDYAVYVIEDTVLDPGDLSTSSPGSLALLYNGTTLTHTILTTVIRNFVKTISLETALASLCPAP